MSVDDEDAIGITANGPGGLESLARQLFGAGFDPGRALIVFRGNHCVAVTSIGRAAGVCSDE